MLNPQAHANVTPIESAHEVWAALSDYIGDPGAAAVDQAQQQLAGPSQASLDESAQESTGESTDELGGETDTNDLPATDAMPAMGTSDAGSDPEATQAASPMLLGITSESRTQSRRPATPRATRGATAVRRRSLGGGTGRGRRREARPRSSSSIR